ncbi:MAG: TrkA C-terminal domain-containing protein [Candidatus Diapherotrites archaeon]|nr:TrkA C-terminal domain-containing protein [Candidatus Diapherotrites archaeon]MDZ4256965.1 TrkA C-terminal domain-containing protein [archaeon]
MRMVENEFKSVLDYIHEMYNRSSVAINLAFSAIILNDKELAEDVIAIEHQMNELKVELEKRVISSRVPAEEVESMAGVLEVAHATEQITNNARTIAAFTASDRKHHPILTKALSHPNKQVYKVAIKKGSTVDGKLLGEAHIEDLSGVSLVAVKQKKQWLRSHLVEGTLSAGDLLLVSGTEEQFKKLEKMVH